MNLQNPARALLALAALNVAQAAAPKDATPTAAIVDVGYVHGDNHCFHFGKPRGWIADASSGLDQGLSFVFYPDTGTWASSPAVIYARVIDKAEGLVTPADQATRTIQQFRTEYESPNS
ncbi:MAG: hypothetical protein ACT4PK_00635, partial [Gammaproteobacteria bacterium]